ncbi:MAG: hypothetical protein RMJ86_05505 [Anaerolineae bacterium]|nr:hypothetical protein [Thermoflexales bacterium]MDW8053983.1 hypothetical protein [Anaerolineae bacterium]
MNRLARVLSVSLFAVLCALPSFFAIGPTREAFQKGAVSSGLVSLIIGGTASLLTFWLALQAVTGHSSVGWALLRWLAAILIGFLGFAVSGPGDPSLPFKLPVALLTALALLPFPFLPERLGGSKLRAAGALISLVFALGVGLVALGFGLFLALATDRQELLFLLVPYALPWVVFWLVVAVGLVTPPRAGTRWLAGVTAAWITVALALYRASTAHHLIDEIRVSPNPLAAISLSLLTALAIPPLFFLLIAFFLLLPKRSRVAPFLFVLNAVLGGVSYYRLLSLVENGATNLEFLLPLLLALYPSELMSGILGVALFCINLLARAER